MAVLTSPPCPQEQSCTWHRERSGSAFTVAIRWTVTVLLLGLCTCTVASEVSEEESEI